MCPLPTPRPPWSIQPFPSYSDASSQTTDDTWTSLRISMNMNAGRSLHSIRTSANNLLAAKIRLATLSNDPQYRISRQEAIMQSLSSINQSVNILLSSTTCRIFQETYAIFSILKYKINRAKKCSWNQSSVFFIDHWKGQPNVQDIVLL